MYIRPHITTLVFRSLFPLFCIDSCILDLCVNEMGSSLCRVQIVIYAYFYLLNLINLIQIYKLVCLV